MMRTSFRPGSDDKGVSPATSAAVGYLAPGWRVDEAGRLKRETKPHMGRRLPGFDYRRPGYYVITIVLADRRTGALGEVVVRNRELALAGQARQTLAGQTRQTLAGQARQTLAGQARPVGEIGVGVSPAPAVPTAGWFSAIGNSFLLLQREIFQVQCSRSFFAYRRDEKGRLLKDEPPAVKTVEFDERLDAALAAARRGAVVISPCISQGEREIARRVFADGGRVITLANKGFSPLYKPGGKLFEQCANGRLLMLAPIAWPYQPAEKPITRPDAAVLNRVAQLIAGEGAAEINYKGYDPGDVDQFVSAAVSTKPPLGRQPVVRGREIMIEVVAKPPAADSPSGIAA